MKDNIKITYPDTELTRYESVDKLIEVKLRRLQHSVERIVELSRVLADGDYALTAVLDELDKALADSQVPDFK